jgi:hypothetical protein
MRGHISNSNHSIIQFYIFTVSLNFTALEEKKKDEGLKFKMRKMNAMMASGLA